MNVTRFSSIKLNIWRTQNVRVSGKTIKKKQAKRAELLIFKLNLTKKIYLRLNLALITFDLLFPAFQIFYGFHSKTEVLHSTYKIRGT